MLDPECLDLGLDREPTSARGRLWLDWLWTILPMTVICALAFGLGYWLGR